MNDQYIYIKNNDLENTYSDLNQEILQLVISDKIFLNNESSVNFHFENCLIDDFRIQASNIINLVENEIEINISFFNCAFKNFSAIYLKLDNLEMNFENCVFKESFNLSNISKLSISNSQLKTSIIRDVGSIEIKDLSEICKSLSIYGGNSIDLFNVKIISIKFINNDYNEYGFLTIKNSEFNDLRFKWDFKNNINIEHCKIDQLVLENCTFSKNALFYNIQPINPNSTNSYVRLVYSNLNNLIFDNFFFNDFNKILLFRNSFENVKFIGCGFPETLKEFDKFLTVEDINNPDKKDVNYSKVRYETFLQLKNALEKSGNYYESNKLKAVSDEALKNIESLPVWDKIILCLNNYTNLHGQSFGRTLSVFIFSTIFLYFLYLKSLGVYMHIFTEFDMYLVKSYFSFIDITHKPDFLNPKGNLSYENTFLSLLIDYVSKIWIAYLIYQFIAAFRKYAKK